MDPIKEGTHHNRIGFVGKYLDPLYRKLLIRGQSPDLAAVNPTFESVEEKDNNLKLDGLVEMSEKPLLRVQTVFPFVFFTNEIIIDANKISIIFREFFASKHVHSVLIKNILDVVIETNPLFATLTIIDAGYLDQPININYLKRSEGKQAHRTIQGLMTAHRQGVDLTKVKSEELLDKLGRVGSNGDLI